MKGKRLIVVLFIIYSIVSIRSVADQAKPITTIVVNDKIIVEKEALPVIEGQLLIPVEAIAYAMGATEVSWYPNKYTLKVEIPFFSESRLYLSYLAGLDQEADTVDYPLPRRLQNLKLPPYPLSEGDSIMIYENPITLVIKDGGFIMPWAIYDYEWIRDKLYVGTEWLNIMFLADVTTQNQQLMIRYPTEKDLEERLAKLERKVRPRTADEALALWLNGQQVRSGALQYSALSKKLQEEVLEKQDGWVTGASSPQIGKATVLNRECVGKDKVIYTVQIEEIWLGKVEKLLEQQIVIEKNKEGWKSHWHITQVEGDMTYSVL